jgi:hypothetical protein
MSKASVKTFALIINYFNDSWILMPVTIGLFKVHETMKLSMAKQLCILFEECNLMHHVIAFVKDENNNLTSMVPTLCSHY